MSAVPKTFPNRSLPEYAYTRLFRCRKCGHYMFYDNHILPGTRCLNCGSAHFSNVATRISRRITLHSVLELLIFSFCFASCEFLLITEEAPSWTALSLAVIFILFFPLFIFIRHRSHNSRLFSALVRELESNASMIRSSYELSSDELADSLEPSNAVAVYLALREMSFVCDSDFLKRTRLAALEYIPKVPMLDFETDELIPSSIDPYSDVAAPDIRLLKYLRIAGRLSPHKLGPASEAILSAFDDIK